MQMIRDRFGFATFFLLLSVWLSGCAAIQAVDDWKINSERYRRFYSGEVLQREQVAIFISTTGWGGGWGCRIDSIDDGKKVKKLSQRSRIGDGELLPGHYLLCLRLDTGGLYSTGGCVARDFNALPGHTYFIDTNISNDRKSWNPIIQDIGRGDDEDFNNIKMIDGRVADERTIRSIRYIYNIQKRGPEWRKPIVQNKDGDWE
jgi:hypothetical protein